MSVRSDLAEFLEDFLDDPTLEVLHADTGATPNAQTDLLIITTSQVAPGIVVGHTRTVTLTVSLVIAKTEPGEADDVLEERLALVLDALDACPWVEWSTAQRGTYADGSFPAVAITVTKEI